MQRRQQYLVIGLVAAIVLWQGGRMLDSSFLEPIRQRQADLEELEETVDLREQDLIVLARQKKSLEQWRRRSLPPDPVTSAKQRPTALNAQRLYQDWLHDLAQLSGFEMLEVKPERLSLSRDSVFVSVIVKIEAEARYEQLCRFLDRFYRADLLHRVTSLRIQSRESEGDPLLQVTLEAEGLAIVGAPQNRRLFPQTTLDEDVSEDTTELTVESTDGFPEQPGFLLRMRSELLRVTEVHGTTWTVERAQDATTAMEHPVGTIIELIRLKDEVPARSAEEIKVLLKSNIFVKPAPPVQYKPRIAPLGDKSLTRGKPIEFTIVAMGFDPSRGKPEFSLVEPLVAGSRLDKSSGKFVWAPLSEQKADKYTFKFEVKHPSATGGKLSQSVTVTLRELNTAPKIASKPVPSIYIGRPWKFVPEASDAESPRDKLAWKLGENPPKGLAIDSRTGEITWTPDETVELGEATAQITVSDDGTPPLSATQSLKLQVQDDAAMFTYLTTIFAINGKPLAKLYDRSQDKYTELRIGTHFTIADIQGTVTQIDKKSLQFSNGEQAHRMEVGQSLREISALKTPQPPVGPPGDKPDADTQDVDNTGDLEPADATRPANIALAPEKSPESSASDRDE